MTEFQEVKNTYYKVYNFNGTFFSRSELSLPDNLNTCKEILAALGYVPIPKLTLSTKVISFDFYVKENQNSPNRIRNSMSPSYAAIQTVADHQEVICLDALPAFNAYLKYASELINTYGAVKKGDK